MDVLSLIDHVSGGRLDEPEHDGCKRSLAASALSCNGDNLRRFSFKVKADVVESPYLLLSYLVKFGYSS